ncbi:MAG TPA: hypothetical protein VGG48_19010 [Rhizomicrobium sp.]
MKISVLTLLAAGLSGCETLSYEEPQPGTAPIARVRFATTSSGVAVLTGFDDPGCNHGQLEWMRLRDGTLVNTTTKMLGMPLANPNQNAAKEVLVTANKPLNLVFFASDQDGPVITGCGTQFTYSYAEGKDYEVKYHWQTGSCFTTISEIVPDGSGWKLVERARFDDTPTDKNYHCHVQYGQMKLPSPFNL